MRPKLKSDTFFIPVDDGVYIRNNEKSFALKGKTLAAWLERLAPVLDGQHDLHTLCEALPEAKRPIIEKLITTLTDQGCIKDTSNEQPHTLSPALLTTYGPAVTFIDYHTDSGAYRFQRFLDTPVLAISSGDGLLALAHALLETGNRAISLLDTGANNTNYARLQEIVHVLQDERDPALHLNILRATDWQNKERLQQLCADTAMVLYFSVEGAQVEIDQLNTLCRQAHVPFLPALALEQAMHIGPLCLPDHAGCWQCYWRRRQVAHQHSVDFAPEQATKDPSYPGKPTIGITANILAQEFFKYATGVKWNTLEEAVSILEWEHLQNVKHTLFPHPLCHVCSPPSPVWLEMFSQQDKPSDDDVSQIEQCADQECGIFSSIDDMVYHQLPLIRSRITVPLSKDGQATLTDVHAAGLDYREARLNASRLALACYLESLADERQAQQAPYQQVQEYALWPGHFFGWRDTSIVSSTFLPWTWAGKLTDVSDTTFDSTPVLIPGATVFPQSKWNYQHHQTLFQPDIPATGIGRSWHEALAESLAQLSSSMSRESSSEQAQSNASTSISPALYGNDPLCIAYLEMLRILQVQVILLYHPNALDIPCVATYLDGSPIGIIAHWNTLCVIRAALRKAVLTAQIQQYPGPGDQIVVPDEKDRATFTQEVSCATFPASLADEAEFGRAAGLLYTRFQRQGWDIVIAPFTQDQTVTRIFPYAMRVLAVQRKSEER
jgi:bacteriocin biosynthesis cyclodehydratase domain-containing protein